MKRSIGAVSPSMSPTRSPPASPSRKRQGSSSGAGRSSPARPDDLPSMRPSLPVDVERSAELTAGNFPRRVGPVPLDQLPRDPFGQIAGLLSGREQVHLAQANPRTLGALLAPDLKLGRLQQAVQAVNTRQAFDALLGRPGDEHDAAAQTVRSLVGRPRAQVLKSLLGRIKTLRPAQQGGALAESIEAVREMPLPLQRRLLVPLMNASVGDVLPSELLGGAWPGLRSLVESQPASQRAQALATLLRRLSRLPEASHLDAANRAFAAVDQLTPAQRAAPLRSLLEALGHLWVVRDPRTVRTGLEATAQLPVEERAATLALLPAIIVATARTDEHAQRVDPHRRDAVRAVREAIAALPAEARGEPFAALAKALPVLPEPERHLEFQVLLRAAAPLPDAEAAKAMKGLFDQIRTVQPASREDALRDSYAAMERLTPEAQAVLLPELIGLTDLLPLADRAPVLRAGLALTQRMPAAKQVKSLQALANAIALLPRAEQAPFIEPLARANAVLPQRHLDFAFFTLQNRTSELVAAGFEEGFDAIRNGIAGMPQALLEMTRWVTLWPRAGQPQRYRALLDDLAPLPAELRATGLTHLAEHIRSVFRNEARPVIQALRAAIFTLPLRLLRQPRDMLSRRLAGVW